MSKDIGAIVEASVTGLGYELVELERTAAGLLRVFIDKPAGISVEDCAHVSNHLSRLFLVEDIDFARLEVSSPGLDRPLKTIADFVRFAGCNVKVKLSASIGNRKKFDGTISAVTAKDITFRLLDDGLKSQVIGKSRTTKSGRAVKGKTGNDPAGQEAVIVTVPISSIERARLIPDI
jgi:ribosome maturation factor RimP